MTLDEAREILAEALKRTDFVNLGRTISALGEYNHTWLTYDNSKWRPNKDLALKDMQWLNENSERITEALKFLAKYRP